MREREREREEAQTSELHTSSFSVLHSMRQVTGTMTLITILSPVSFRLSAELQFCCHCAGEN